MIKAIDLFAGCGGFSTGFMMDGYKIISAVEFDKSIALSYKHNHPDTKLFVDDIKNVDNNLVFKNGDADVIIGGPPCQGFSMAGARIRNGFIDDPRNYLFKHYFNIVRIINPKIFVIENVKGLLTMKNGEIINEIKAIFENPEYFDGQPYKLQFKVFKADLFGVPQKRERVLLIGSKINFDLENEVLATKKYIIKNIDERFFDDVTVGDAIAGLPSPTESGKVSNLVPKNHFQKFLSNPNGTTTNHNATNHSKFVIERMKKVLIDENFSVLDENIKSIHSGSYGRMNPNTVSATITTRFDTPSGGRFTHPFENRTITPREAARIQSFPDSFEFIGSKTSIHKQIGNAVPPKLAYFIAIMIRRILCQEHI